MPTYEYECAGCGAEVEIFHGISDGPKRKCPECGKLKLKKLISSGGGLIFKGSGFYITDYRSDSYKKDASADKAPSSSESSSSKKPSETSSETSSKKSTESSSSESSSPSSSSSSGSGKKGSG